METQGLSFRGTLFLITVGTGLGALLPVVAGIQPLTAYWWLGAYALTLAGILRMFHDSQPVEDHNKGKSR